MGVPHPSRLRLAKGWESKLPAVTAQSGRERVSCAGASKPQALSAIPQSALHYVQLLSPPATARDGASAPYLRADAGASPKLVWPVCQSGGGAASSITRPGWKEWSRLSRNGRADDERGWAFPCACGESTIFAPTLSSKARTTRVGHPQLERLGHPPCSIVGEAVKYFLPLHQPQHASGGAGDHDGGEGIHALNIYQRRAAPARSNAMLSPMPVGEGWLGLTVSRFCESLPCSRFCRQRGRGFPGGSRRTWACGRYTGRGRDG